MKKLFLLLLLFVNFAYSQVNEVYRDTSITTTGDSRANFLLWHKCIQKKLRPIIDGDFPVFATGTLKIDHDVIVSGRHKSKSKIILENTIVPFYAERGDVIVDGKKIGTEAGYNMHLDNISLVTLDYELYGQDADYLSKIKLGNFYKFQQVEAPDKIVKVDFIKVTNCFIGGSIQIKLIALDNQNEIPGYGVKQIDILDNEIKYPYLLVAASAFSKVVNIKRNHIWNLHGYVFSIKRGNIVYMEHNHIENTYVATKDIKFSGSYFTPLLCTEQNIIEARYNTFKNILSKGSNVAYPIYPSVNTLIFEDNEVTDCMYVNAGAESCLFKIKGANNWSIKRNNITLTRGALVKLGLLKSVDAPIESVNNITQMCILSVSNNFAAGYTTEISNNTFTAPYINMASYLINTNTLIKNNTFNFEYISEFTSNAFVKNPLLYYVRQGGGSVESLERGAFVHTENTYNIGKSHNGKLGIFGMDKVSHSYVDNSNNNYYSAEPIDFTFGKVNADRPLGTEGHLSKVYRATGNFVSNGSVEDMSAMLIEFLPYPYQTSNYVDYTIDNYTGDGNSAIAGIQSFGQTKVKVLQNHSDEFGVFRFLYTYAVWSKGIPYFTNGQAVSVMIKINATRSDGTEEIVNYNIPIRDFKKINNHSVIYRSGVFETPVPGDKKSDIVLKHKNFEKGDAGYFSFENLKNYQSFDILVSVHKTKKS